MVADLLAEHRISMTELARQEKVAVPTVWRWRQKGVRGIKLETFMSGGRRFTTHEAHQRFITATTAAADGVDVSTLQKTNRQREASISRAERELDEAGI